MREGGFLGARAAASEAVGVEQRVDKPIWIVIGFGQRLARGAAPELARLDAFEIDSRCDLCAKLPYQRMLECDGVVQAYENALSSSILA